MAFKVKEKFDKELLDSIKEKAKGQSKNCIFNAVHHLEMAHKIKNIDPEMACFRCITAEEEAASAIFLILKEHQYDNAKKIRHMNHNYKQALNDFIISVVDFLNSQALDKNFPFKNNISLVFNHNTGLVELNIYFKNKPLTATPKPPLDFSITINDQPYHFENELKKLASHKNVKKLEDAISEKANFRILLLYASSQGSTKIKEGTIENIIDDQYNIVFKFIRIYGLIYPYKKDKPVFVQQTLNAFLVMMEALAVEDEKKLLPEDKT